MMDTTMLNSPITTKTRTLVLLVDFLMATNSESHTTEIPSLPLRETLVQVAQATPRLTSTSMLSKLSVSVTVIASLLMSKSISSVDRRERE